MPDDETRSGEGAAAPSGTDEPRPSPRRPGKPGAHGGPPRTDHQDRRDGPEPRRRDRESTPPRP